MAEIAALPRNGLRVVSTFSGCGGSCLGFEMAGFSILWASEFVPEAREVYALNHPGVPIDERDVRDVTAEDVLDALGMERGEIDVLEGSPPCSSFSTAGAGARGWGKVNKYSSTAQRTDDLFFEFVRLLAGLQPRTFVAENVAGLVKGAAKGYFLRVHQAMQDAGYRVEARLLDAQWLGVPQARRRVIFQGVREDIGREPAWPKPLPYRYSIRDALPWIGDARAEAHGPNSWPNQALDAEDPAPTVGTEPDSASRYRHSVVEFGPQSPFYDPEKRLDPDEPLAAVVAQNPTQFRVKVVHDAGPFVDPETGQNIALDGLAIADAWDVLSEGSGSERYFNLVRPDRDVPAPTVTMTGGTLGAASLTHPIARRKLTLLELRRLCGFPDDFILTGTYAQRWERLGRAVPPPMMRAVAEALRDGPLA